MMDMWAKEEELGLEQEEGQRWRKEQTKYTCIICKNKFRGERLNNGLTA